MTAIQAATSQAAAVMGREDEIGSVRPGWQADLIAVQGDPLAGISALRDLRLVMQAGSVQPPRRPRPSMPRDDRPPTEEDQR
jgi:imidazolonepropionase-like amidohydrolase